MNRNSKIFMAFGLASLLSSSALQASLVVYPKKGQSEKQQAADKSKCSQWATQQTGIEPEQLLEQSQQSAQVAPPPGGGAVRGAGKGAAVGAIGGAIGGDAGKGAEIGAGVGAAGGAAKKGRERRAESEHQAQSSAQTQQKLNTYEKAQKACLEGKGYSVS
jgi:hypothetical protein